MHVQGLCVTQPQEMPDNGYLRGLIHTAPGVTSVQLPDAARKKRRASDTATGGPKKHMRVCTADEGRALQPEE